MTNTGIFVIFHLDGTVTLVEQTSTERTFTPLESVSQTLSLVGDGDCPSGNIITETPTLSWRQQLAERSRV